MIDEDRSASALTDSHSAPETRHIKERVQALRENLSELSETIEVVQKKLREAADKAEKSDE